MSCLQRQHNKAMQNKALELHEEGGQEMTEHCITCFRQATSASPCPSAALSCLQCLPPAAHSAHEHRRSQPWLQAAAATTHFKPQSWQTTGTMTGCCQCRPLRTSIDACFKFNADRLATATEDSTNEGGNAHIRLSIPAHQLETIGK